ncbi:MAG: DUF371 domain-containing protein [Methanobacteriaceae archaeon]|nr:DUF371 domain-containing protein [Methanobacteriaceae archaeon]
MNQYTFKTKGHKNITSKHKTTLEFTTDKNITPKGDCIIGTNSETTLKKLPTNIKNKIQTDNTKITITLKTENHQDTIHGEGSSKLTLDHPTDMVCRKSNYTCNRTLIINADKAAKDINRELIKELQNNKELTITIQTK